MTEAELHVTRSPIGLRLKCVQLRCTFFYLISLHLQPEEHVILQEISL